MLTMTPKSDILKMSTERRIFYVYQNGNLKREEPNRFSVDRLGLPFLLEDSMETKFCNKCNKLKSLTDFHNRKKSKDERYFYCKECKNKEKREWTKNNLEKNRLYHSIYQRKYVYKNRDKINKYFKDNPWLKTYGYISNRCNCKKTCYYKKGIKNKITEKELKILWFRDKGYLMKRPSIDRIDPKGHYTLNNCRFIELKENLYRAIKPSEIPIIQKDLNGNIISKFNSMSEASRSLGKNVNFIRNTLRRGQHHKFGGYIWEYGQVKQAEI